MSDCMTFPDTVEEFMEQYKVTDTDHVYSNGTEFVPIFRMKQWFDHKPEPHWIPTSKKPDPDLPEEDMSGYFLVTLHTYGNIGFDMDEYEVKKMRWDRVNGWVLPVHSPAWIEDALTQDVLAWKPCPEPYREDGVE